MALPMMAIQAGLPIATSALQAWLGSRSADKQAGDAKAAAYGAARLQGQGLDRAGGIYGQHLGEMEGLVRSGAGTEADYLRRGGDVRADYLGRALGTQQQYYDRGLDYLSPHIQAGYGAEDMVGGALGLGGPEASQAALEAYRGSPSASILDRVLAERARETAGEYAAGGLRGSGAYQEELARRLSDIELGDYGKWRGEVQNVANRGYGAATTGSQLAGSYGTQLGSRQAQIGDVLGGTEVGLGKLYSGADRDVANLRGRRGDYMAQIAAQRGTIDASALVGGTNAMNRGRQAQMDYLSPVLGRLGKIDLAGMFRNQPAATGWNTTMTRNPAYA